MELWDVIVVEVDDLFVVVFFDGDIGDDDLVVIVGEVVVGSGIEGVDFFDGDLYVVYV